jgi:hypothetical protein
MIVGQIQLQGFGYQILDTQGHKVVDGKPVGEPFPMKALAIVDVNSGLQITLAFTPEQFEEFGEKMRGGKILAARAALPFIRKNGQ